MNEKNCDMHCHILPGVDDGAKNMDISRRMLEMAQREGIYSIIATPHYHPGKSKGKIDQWNLALEAVQELAGQIDSRFKIFSGSEIWYQHGIEELLLSRKLWTMCGTHYVLIEFSAGAGFSYMRDGLFNLQRSGFYPILAHVERYSCLTDIGKVRELAEMGIYLQMNADTALMGKQVFVGRQIRNLLKQRCIHFIGTDAHDVRHRNLRMRECRAYVGKLCGYEYANEICSRNTRKVIAGEKILLPY